MKYDELISTLMPLVRGASNVPCLIWSENGEWNLDYLNLPQDRADEYTAEIRAKDPFVVRFVGQDLSAFASDIKHSFLHNKVLAMRIRAEYIPALSWQRRPAPRGR